MKMILKNQVVQMLVIVLVVTTIGFGEKSKKYDEGKLYRHSLKNGMTVLTMERHIAPLIYHQVTYRVGSRNETLGITGISHVVEHLMFKGTPKYGKGEASKTITKNSGVFNAFTMNDMTSYYEYLLNWTKSSSENFLCPGFLHQTFLFLYGSVPVLLEFACP